MVSWSQKKSDHPVSPSRPGLGACRGDFEIEEKMFAITSNQCQLDRVLVQVVSDRLQKEKESAQDDIDRSRDKYDKLQVSSEHHIPSCFSSLAFFFLDLYDKWQISFAIVVCLKEIDAVSPGFAECPILQILVGPWPKIFIYSNIRNIRQSPEVF